MAQPTPEVVSIVPYCSHAEDASGDECSLLEMKARTVTASQKKRRRVGKEEEQEEEKGEGSKWRELVDFSPWGWKSWVRMPLMETVDPS